MALFCGRHSSTSKGGSEGMCHCLLEGSLLFRRGSAWESILAGTSLGPSGTAIQVLGRMTPQSLAMPGIYAILETDARWSPKPYRVLYFGESSNVLRHATGAHERFSSWRATARHAKPLYRALCPMPGSTKHQRQQVENLLIRNYGPHAMDAWAWRAVSGSSEIGAVRAPRVSSVPICPRHGTRVRCSGLDENESAPESPPLSSSGYRIRPLESKPAHRSVESDRSVGCDPIPKSHSTVPIRT